MDDDLTEALVPKNSDESPGTRRESSPPLSPSSRNVAKNPTESSDSSSSGAPVRDNSKNHQELGASSAASDGKQGPVSTGEEEAAAATLDCWGAAAATLARWGAAVASAARRKPGRSTSEARDGSSGVAVSGRTEHLIRIPPPGAAGLIHRAKRRSDSWRTDPILAGPSADLAVALQEFAAEPDATTAARLEQAAAAFDSIASSNTEDGAVAKQLATEAAALAAGWRGDDRQGSSAFETAASETAASRQEPELPAPEASHSTEFLLCFVMAGTLGLLPYLPTQVPKQSRRVFAVLFGLVFFLASVGGMLLIAPVHKRAANTIAGVSFATFTVLVMAFIGFALGGRTYS
ncbi:hypothetical protein D1007_39380 [Hordeum vulgare]|uniref:Predicted protein n=1 Tax=Hordeum vulgare subsp. vulgare TaxID=112509 RepID=F2DWB9_HORVV|nr:hypothetical protein D1007_39380 [Hordeum vulgare]BAJ99390.1 predicted protein [Hordeum vulgare subsp. vulgare]